MCNSVCEERLNGKMDVILEKLEPIANGIDDHENRIRLIEQYKCPKHHELNEKVDDVVITQAVGNVKLAIMVGISGSVGSMITLSVVGILMTYISG